MCKPCFPKSCVSKSQQQCDIICCDCETQLLGDCETQLFFAQISGGKFFFRGFSHTSCHDLLGMWNVWYVERHVSCAYCDTCTGTTSSCLTVCTTSPLQLFRGKFTIFKSVRFERELKSKGWRLETWNMRTLVSVMCCDVVVHVCCRHGVGACVLSTP